MNTAPRASLRVLHAPGGAAGQPSCISRAQTKLGLTAHSLRVGENKFGYPADIVVPANGPASYCEALTQVADSYDVFHFYFRPFFYHNVYNEYPLGLDVLALRAAGKAVILHFRGSEIRLHSVFMERCPHNYVLEDPERIISKFPETTQRQYLELMQAVCSEVLVTDPELLTYCPQAKIVPRAINLDDWPYVGLVEHHEPPLIVHAPSRRTVKGTDILMKALDALRNQGVSFRLQLVENMSHAEAREIYHQADIVVDQLRIGWYGVLSVEAMALGKPVLAYIREDLRHHLPDPPLVMTSPETLEQDLKKIITDSAYRMKLSRKARQYAEAVHDSRMVAKQLVDIYEDCLQRPRPIDFHCLGEYINRHPYYLPYKKIFKKMKAARATNVWQQILSYTRQHGVKQTLIKIFQRLFGRS